MRRPIYQIYMGGLKPLYIRVLDLLFSFLRFCFSFKKCFSRILHNLYLSYAMYGIFCVGKNFKIIGGRI